MTSVMRVSAISSSSIVSERAPGTSRPLRRSRHTCRKFSGGTRENGRVAAPDQSTAPRRRGRRPGGGDTRAALLDSARAVFAERGYEGATVRAIAERAGVDPAMVNHFFGGKEGLFIASLDLPFDAGALINDVVPGDPDRIAERIVPRFLQLWD